MLALIDKSFTSPAANLALDELLLAASEGGAGGFLRFYESPVPFVVVGYGNRVASEVNVAACRAEGIPILRRISGGGTVLQGPGCLNYALILPIEEKPGHPLSSITAANRFIMERQAAAFSRILASPVEVRGTTDLVWRDRKFSGNAQRRVRGALLFHGTILHAFDLARVSRWLLMPSLQPDYRAGRSHDDFIGNVPVDPATVRQQLAATWEACAGGEISEEQVEILARKYEQPDWNFKF